MDLALVLSLLHVVVCNNHSILCCFYDLESLRVVRVSVFITVRGLRVLSRRQ